MPAFKVSVAITCEVFAIIERAVENKKWCNDFKGVWYDIAYMAYLESRQHLHAVSILFNGIITGTGQKGNHTFTSIISGGGTMKSRS